MNDLKEFLLDEFEAKRKPVPVEDTYVSTDYYLDGNKLIFEPTVEFDVAHEKRWALGVIYYYLVIGYPELNGEHKVNFHDEIGLGPRVNTTAWKKLVEKGHTFPSK